MSNIEVRAEGASSPATDATPRSALERLLPAASLVTLGVGASLSPTADAATFTVTNLNDGAAGSLRQAIADADAAVGPDVVVFQAGLTGTITLTTGDIAIVDSVDIQGPGATNLTVSGGNTSRVFYLYNGKGTSDVTISGMTLTGGGGVTFGSSIICFTENLTLDEVVVTGNAATVGGAIAMTDLGEPGISLQITDSTISGNTAGRDGGGIYLYSVGQLVITDTTISGNTATQEGGGVYGLYTGAMIVTGSTISGNTAATSGGGVYALNVPVVNVNASTFQDNDATAFVGGGLAWVIEPGDRADVSDMVATRARGDTGRRERTALRGGPVAAIRGSTFSGNTAASGGGLMIAGVPGAVPIENSTISGNQATALIRANGQPMPRGGAGLGGGITLYYANDVQLHHVTISDNTAATMGGGVHITQPTLARGGGSNTDISHAIIANNAAPTNADISTDMPASADVRFSLIETAGTATLVDGGGNVFNQDPQLGALANNGGTTQTHLPAAASPVVNAGDPAFAPPPATDQRGLPRVQGGRIDIGSVEGEPPVPGTVQLTATTANAAEGTPTVTLTASRTGGDDGAISVDFASANGSAIAPGDYAAAMGTLNWADGDVADKSITVNIVDDAAVETPETFTVTLSNPQGGTTLGANTSATVTIADNDVLSGGNIQFAITNVSVNETGGTVTLTVSRNDGGPPTLLAGTGPAPSGAGVGPATVDFATANGTAAAPGDFTATNGTLTWGAGDLTDKTIVVPIMVDDLAEPDETFSVTLSNPTGGAVISQGNGTATVTILANAAVGGTPVSVPSTDTWAKLLMAGLLAAAGAYMLRKRREQRTR